MIPAVYRTLLRDRRTRRLLLPSFDERECGNYVNFQLAEDDAARTADAYGKNFERLRRIKADYDPDNLFRVNRNFSPAA